MIFTTHAEAWRHLIITFLSSEDLKSQNNTRKSNLKALHFSLPTSEFNVDSYFSFIDAIDCLKEKMGQKSRRRRRVERPREIGKFSCIFDGCKFRNITELGIKWSKIVSCLLKQISDLVLEVFLLEIHASQFIHQVFSEFIELAGIDQEVVKVYTTHWSNPTIYSRRLSSLILFFYNTFFPILLRLLFSPFFITT